MHGAGVQLGGRYRLDERIGGGGMGEVWRGTDEVLGRTVAVKIMLPALLDEPGFAERFKGEARTMARLKHPGVVNVYDYSTDSSTATAFLVMEYVEGDPLSRTLGRVGRLTAARTMALIAQAADALEAAHAAGIVHRDLKPDNVMVEPRGEGQWLVKVLDFGIARVMLDDAPADDAPARALTRLGTVMGTPGYMAPEQAMGEKVDARADIYALGAILWEMIAGRPRYETNDLTAIVTRQLTQPPPDPGAVAGDPTVPPGLVELTARMLSSRPDDRPAKAAEVRAPAVEVLSGLEGHAGEALHGDSGMARPDDVALLISNSGETAEVCRFADLLTTWGVAIIALTAHALQSERQRTERAGCDGFLAKPCAPPDLLAEITRHSRFTAEEFRTLATERPIDIADLHRRIRSMIEDAESFIGRIPSEAVGVVFLDGGKPVQPDLIALEKYERRAGARRGQAPRRVVRRLQAARPLRRRGAQFRRCRG